MDDSRATAEAPPDAAAPPDTAARPDAAAPDIALDSDAAAPDTALGSDAADTPDPAARLAARLVAGGRFVPGLTVDDHGRARSWWWPLPAADDRGSVRSLLADASPAAHAAAARALAVAVDSLVRSRMAGADPLPRRPGRRTLPEEWLRSLTRTDPWLPDTTDPQRARALADAVTAWVASGRVSAGGLGVCLRIHEPEAAAEPAGDASPSWTVEVLVADADDPGLRLPLSAWWPDAARYGPERGRGLLADLARAVRVAPELSGLLDAPVPASVDVDDRAVLALLRDRVEPLTDLGVQVLLPAWWTGRSRVGLRAKARSGRSPAADGASGGEVALDQLVDFRWEAALGDVRLTRDELQDLAEAADARRELVRVRGKWVQLRPDDLQRVLERVGRRGRATAADLLRAGLGIASLDGSEDLPIHGVDATGWLGMLMDEALHARILPVDQPEGFAGMLRPYQARGVGWLAFLGRLGLGACLADDMGLGKTAQLIGSLLADPAPGPTLVVCPVSVLGNWERELGHFAPGLNVVIHHGSDRDAAGLAASLADRDVVLTTYSLIHRDIDALADVQWGRLVLDEAQQVKNPGTAAARAVRRLRAARRVALTGTPVENRLAELWSIMDVVSPGLLGPMREFKQTFALPIERDADEDATGRLKRITGPFILRRLKSDPQITPDLPDKIERTDRCVLTREQALLYQAVVAELLVDAASKEGIDRRGAVLAGLAKLKQVCNHPALLLGDGSALPGRSGKLTRTEELLDEILDSGERILAFTQYRTWGDLLVPHLSRRFGVEPLWLHGGVPRSRRDAMVADFQSDSGPPVMLISLRAGGTGLTLTRASHVIHLDRWWNPAVEDQATDRAHRIGQSRSVFVHRLVTAGTVEERIDEMIARKRDLARRVVGTGESWLTELSTDDLRAAVALRTDGEEGSP